MKHLQKFQFKDHQELLLASSQKDTKKMTLSEALERLSAGCTKANVLQRIMEKTEIKSDAVVDSKKDDTSEVKLGVWVHLHANPCSVH